MNNKDNNRVIDNIAGQMKNMSVNSDAATAKKTDGESVPKIDQKIKTDTIVYDAQSMIGHGSFGAVFLATVTDTNEKVAIKKVLQDKRFKNRELQIMVQLSKQPHPYIVGLKHHFSTKDQRSPDEVYLNLVLEYVPETIYSIAKSYSRRKESMPIFSIKIYMYQLARALAHIHGMGICHRYAIVFILLFFFVLSYIIHINIFVCDGLILIISYNIVGILSHIIC